MIIYNITSNVDESVHDNWLSWMKEHIPQVLSTGKFNWAKLSKVLVEEDMGGTTYSVQFGAKSRKDLEDYYSNYAKELRQDGINRFSDKVVSFRTELEIIDEYSVSFD